MTITLLQISSWYRKLFQSFSSLMKVIFLSKIFCKLSKIKTNSDRIIILGNGPSLKEDLDSNIENIKNNELICVNHFANSNYYEVLKPRHYVAIAYDLFMDDVLPHFIEASNILFENIANKTFWDMYFYVPHIAKKHKRWQNIILKNKNISIIYINLTPVEGFKCFRHFLYNNLLGMPRPHNVMIPSIFIALNLKVKEIALLGVDHSWLKEIHVDDNNNVLFFNKHFYDNQNSAKGFDRYGKEFLKLHEILITLSRAFESYHILNEFSKSKKINIFNCTKGSYIDAFERKNITDFLKL